MTELSVKRMKKLREELGLLKGFVSMNFCLDIVDIVTLKK